jgi:hypothetical protein
MKRLMYRLAVVWSLVLGTSMVTLAQAQEVKKKTTKSRKGKYAAIGAGVGAGTGVAVSKNNSKGAVIGGVVGAGTGYIYGKHRDKKKGRKVKY